MSGSDAQSKVVYVNEFNFETEVLGASLPVLVDVTASWCGPCKLAAPLISELSRQHAGRLKVVELDGGECPDLVARLGVRGFPTFLGVVRGQVIERRLGFSGKRGLDDLATSLLSSECPP
ncbi:MAG TPA: thioredoxin family protein [Polyangiaceae bacterium]|jgi:thioredoxin 1|nr:thioredoxin family protein [Polyangiaceae bacterium]